MNSQYATKVALEAPARQSVAIEVTQFADSLANRAQQLVGRVNEKLQPVMSSEVPRACSASTKESMEYPPLFADLRSNFQAISSALESIEYAMSRTEL